MKTVMILGGNDSELPVIERAMEFGHRVVVVDRDENSPGLKLKGVIAENSSISDKEEVLRLAQKYSIDGIVPSVDAGVRSAAYVARVMGLPGITEEAALWGTDKTHMRKKVSARGLPVPKFAIVNTYEEYKAAIADFDGKCVVKAPDTSGSRGIYRVNDTHNAEETDYAYNYCKEYSGSGELLIEELMQGLEICVETLNSKGVCYPIQISDEKYKEPPFFIDCGYSQPSVLDADMQARIRQIAVEANMAIENFQGSSCTEMIVTEEGPKIVEIGVRLAADFMTTKMVPLSNGVDMPGAVIKIALGEDIDVTPTREAGSCIRYFMKERVGKIVEIKGVEEARKVPGVVQVGVLKKVGDTAVPLRKSADRLAFVLTQGATNAEAVAAAEKAVGLIDFVVEEE